jgi:hypothetical protein
MKINYPTDSEINAVKDSQRMNMAQSRHTISGREEIALAFFTALLPRALDEADRMAFPEGALKLMKLEISAAWEMADLWISEREEKYPTWK